MELNDLIKYRSQLISENNMVDIDYINRKIEKLENEFVTSIMEDGDGGGDGGGDSSMSYSGNGGGMGSIISPQPSIYPGDVSGSTIGSGDVSFPYNVGNGYNAMSSNFVMGKNHGARTGKKSRTKKIDMKALKASFDAKRKKDGTDSTPKSKKILSFDDFKVKDLDKVTKVKDI